MKKPLDDLKRELDTVWLYLFSGGSVDDRVKALEALESAQKRLIYAVDTVMDEGERLNNNRPLPREAAGVRDAKVDGLRFALEAFDTSKAMKGIA